MSWPLRESPEALAADAARVAGATGIPMAHVEKDFWVTEVLRGVARCGADTRVSAVFKGGTSLSKAFGLIRRFSDDVDVIVVTPGHSTGQDDRCLKSFVAATEASTAPAFDPAVSGPARSAFDSIVLGQLLRAIKRRPLRQRGDQLSARSAAALGRGSQRCAAHGRPIPRDRRQHGRTGPCPRRRQRRPR